MQSVQRVEKNFEVKNYVIPLIDVGIEVPSKVAFSDKSFAMSANAKYKNSQPALGKVKVAFYVLTMNYNYYGYATEYKLRYQKMFDISDAITFEVLLAEHLKVSESESVRIDAEFIEDATQKVYVESVYTDIVPYKHHINVDAKSYFIQGKTYEFTVYVKDFNNKPVIIYLHCNNFCGYLLCSLLRLLLDYHYVGVFLPTITLLGSTFPILLHLRWVQEVQQNLALIRVNFLIMLHCVSIVPLLVPLITTNL